MYFEMSYEFETLFWIIIIAFIFIFFGFSILFFYLFFSFFKRGRIKFRRLFGFWPGFMIEKRREEEISDLKAYEKWLELELERIRREIEEEERKF